MKALKPLLVVILQNKYNEQDITYHKTGIPHQGKEKIVHYNDTARPFINGRCNDSTYMVIGSY